MNTELPLAKVERLLLGVHYPRPGLLLPGKRPSTRRPTSRRKTPNRLLSPTRLPLKCACRVGTPPQVLLNPLRNPQSLPSLKVRTQVYLLLARLQQVVNLGPDRVTKGMCTYTLGTVKRSKRNRLEPNRLTPLDPRSPCRTLEEKAPIGTTWLSFDRTGRVLKRVVRLGSIVHPRMVLSTGEVPLLVPMDRGMVRSVSNRIAMPAVPCNLPRWWSRCTKWELPLIR